MSEYDKKFKELVQLYKQVSKDLKSKSKSTKKGGDLPNQPLPPDDDHKLFADSNVEAEKIDHYLSKYKIGGKFSQGPYNKILPVPEFNEEIFPTGGDLMKLPLTKLKQMEKELKKKKK